MTEKYGRILVVDDDEDVLQAARLFLKQHVSRVRTETSPECLPDLVNDEEFDVYPTADIGVDLAQRAGRLEW